MLNVLDEYNEIEQIKAILSHRYCHYLAFTTETIKQINIDIKNEEISINTEVYLKLIYVFFFKDILKIKNAFYRKKDLDSKENRATISHNKIRRELYKLNEEFPLSYTMTTLDIATYHNKFLNISPFIEGNEQIAKLLMIAQCLHSGLNPPEFFGLNNQRSYKATLFSINRIEKLLLKNNQ